MKRSGMGTGTVVALSVLGLAAVGVTIGVAMGSSKPSGPPPAAKDTDLQRGYQVLPSCKIKVLGDESLVYKWAASLGSDPAMSIPQAIAKAIDNCSPQAAAMAAISSPEDIRILYNFLHALKSAAVAAGKYSKEQFNAEIAETMGLIKMYGGGIDTTGWPGPLP